MKVLPLAMMLSAFPFLAAAGAIEDGMKTYVETEIRAKMADPMVIAAVTSANAANASLSPNDILTLDGQWRAEVGKDSTLIKGVAENPTSAMLRDLVSASGGKVTEVIVMDAQGLNVAVSDITSDYWQGDEDKWQKTFQVGGNTVFIDAPEFDADLKATVVQLNMSVDDPQTKKPIGAATFQVNLTEMQRRR